MSTPAAHPPRQRSDAALLAAHLDGDPYAFAELFHRHHRQLLRVACRRTRSGEDAADAVQEAMLAAHRHAAGFRHHSTVSTWLHRIVVNKCRDQYRRLPLPLAECARQAVHDGTGSIDTAVLVHRALRALPPQQRAAVLAVDLHDYSIADAADLLGVSPGTVKSRRARGRARLAELLAGAAAA